MFKFYHKWRKHGGICDKCYRFFAFKNSMLYEAAYRGHVNCVKALLKRGADVNFVHSCGWTALVNATNRGHDECVELLIKSGADVNSTSNRPALMFAAYRCGTKCVEMLIRAGAGVNAIDGIGCTALMTCSLENEFKWVSLLLEEGVDVNKFNNFGQNAIQRHIFERTRGFLKPNKAMVMLLYAAGETIDGTTIIEKHCLGLGTPEEKPVPDYLLFKDLKLNLKHLAREAIRKHLINIDPHKHLFGRIPQLGLPPSLTKYLLFNISLNRYQRTKRQLQN